MTDVMPDEPIRTIWWVDPSTADLVVLDVPTDVADALGRGEPVTWRGGSAPRRVAADDAIPALQARQDQLRSRMDEFVTEWPQLKASRSRR
jgi:hypothetical protein